MPTSAPPEIVDSARFDAVLRAGTRLIDVRAPVEYAKGTLPGAINAPILADDERAAVGTRYKEAGQQSAIELGHELVRGDVRAARIAAWKRLVEHHPDALIYCWRGGLRSRLAQRWLAEAGLPRGRIEGGFKAMRNHLCARLASLAARLPAVVIGGHTGTAKTRLLQTFDRQLDLEGYANHRGSSFGRRPDGQPTPIDFEHRVALRLLHLGDEHLPILLEDESRLVGRLAVPPPLFERMQQAPVAQIVEPVEVRVENLHRDYIIESGREHDAVFGEDGQTHFHAALLDALDRIRKRLGGANHTHIRALMESAIAEQRRTGATEPHKLWIRAVLERYYDGLYAWQLEQKQDRIAFRGSYDEVRAWLSTRFEPRQSGSDSGSDAALADPDMARTSP